jgi:hypothetical protein
VAAASKSAPAAFASPRLIAAKNCWTTVLLSSGAASAIRDPKALAPITITTVADRAAATRVIQHLRRHGAASSSGMTMEERSYSSPDHLLVEISAKSSVAVRVPDRLNARSF